MKSRFTAEQIVGVLQDSASGAGKRELCRKHPIGENTFYLWRQKYGRMQVSEAKRLKALEDENRRLKKLVAALSLDNAMLKDVAGRKW